MNYAQLGAKVKTKYPQYKDLADDELGKRIVDKYPEYKAQITEESGGNFIENFLPSLGKNVAATAEGLANIVNPNLEQNTIANLGRLVFGAGEKAAEALVGNPRGYTDKNMQMAEGVGQFYGDRYGGVENVKKTINEDPVGFLLDASTVLTAGGSALSKAGQAGKLGKLAKVGQTVSKVGEVIDPIQASLRGTGAVIDIAGNSKVGQKLQAPFRGSYDADAVRAANELGVDLPLSAQTNSKVVRGTEALLQKGIFGGKIGKKIETARAKVDELLTNYTTKNETTPDLKGTGEIIQKGFGEFQDNFREMKTDLYNKVPDNISKAPADVTKTSQALTEIIDNKSGSLVPGSNVTFYRELLAKIAPDGQPAKLTLNNLRKTRTQIGERLKNYADPVSTGDRASLGKLYASLSDDIDTTIKTVDPSYGEALDTANAYYRETIEKINSNVGRKIANSTPEKLVDELIKPNSETTVQLVKEVVGDEAFGALQESFLQTVIQKSINARTGQIDLQKLNTQLTRYGDATLKAVLSKDQLKRLDTMKSQLTKIDTVDQAIKRGTRVADGSQTAFLLETGGLGGMLFANPVLAAKYIVGKFIANKAFNSKFGQQYLTTGVDATNPAISAIQKMAQVESKTRPAVSVLRNMPQVNDRFEVLRRSLRNTEKTARQSANLLP